MWTTSAVSQCSHSKLYSYATETLFLIHWFHKIVCLYAKCWTMFRAARCPFTSTSWPNSSCISQISWQKRAAAAEVHWTLFPSLCKPTVQRYCTLEIAAGTTSCIQQLLYWMLGKREICTTVMKHLAVLTSQLVVQRSLCLLRQLWLFHMIHLFIFVFNELYYSFIKTSDTSCSFSIIVIFTENCFGIFCCMCNIGSGYMFLSFCNISSRICGNFVYILQKNIWGFSSNQL